MSTAEPLTTAVQARAPDAQDRSERGQARRERWRLLRRRPAFIFGVVVLVFWVVCAIGGENISPYGAKQTGLPSTQPPSRDYLFGTDTLGRDVFSRLIHGAQVSLGVAMLGALGALVLGTLVGGIAGYRGGLVDETLMRVAEFVFVLPLIYVVLALRAVLPLVVARRMKKCASCAQVIAMPPCTCVLRFAHRSAAGAARVAAIAAA